MVSRNTKLDTVISALDDICTDSFVALNFSRRRKPEIRPQKLSRFEVETLKGDRDSSDKKGSRLKSLLATGASICFSMVYPSFLCLLVKVFQDGSQNLLSAFGAFDFLGRMCFIFIVKRNPDFTKPLFILGVPAAIATILMTLAKTSSIFSLILVSIFGLCNGLCQSTLPLILVRLKLNRYRLNRLLRALAACLSIAGAAYFSTNVSFYVIGSVICLGSCLAAASVLVL